MSNSILIISFGGKYSHLIAKRIRKLGVYCLVVPHTVSIDHIKNFKPNGIILTDDPNDVCVNNAKTFDTEIFNLNVPILGIGYGALFTIKSFDGEVEPNETAAGCKMEKLVINCNSVLFNNTAKTTICPINKLYSVLNPPDNFKTTSTVGGCHTTSFENTSKNVFALQFYPDVEHTGFGTKVISNFVFSVCRCDIDWSPKKVLENKINDIKRKIGDNMVICGVSSNVGSVITAMMLHEVIGDSLTCVFIDHGFLETGERNYVEKLFKNKLKIKNFTTVDMGERFLSKLKGISDLEQKKTIIEREFAFVLEKEAEKSKKIDFLVKCDVLQDNFIDNSQIYFDVDRPQKSKKFEIIEPLIDLYRSEIKTIGKLLKIPNEILSATCYSSFGIATKIVGEITSEKIDIVRNVDAILSKELAEYNYHNKVYQFSITLDDITCANSCNKDVGYTVIIKATLNNASKIKEWIEMIKSIADTVATRIINEVNSVNKILLDITPESPAIYERK